MSENHFAMASEWMENGNINEFIDVHPDANRFKLVRYILTAYRADTDGRLSQLTDVARGLIYMHDQGMIHGDLKGV